MRDAILLSMMFMLAGVAVCFRQVQFLQPYFRVIWVLHWRSIVVYLARLFVVLTYMIFQVTKGNRLFGRKLERLKAEMGEAR